MNDIPSLGHKRHRGLCLAAASWIAHSGRSQLPYANNAQKCSGEVHGEINGNFLATTTTSLSAMYVSHHGTGASSPSRAFRWWRLRATPFKTLNGTTELSGSQIPDPQKPFELINIYYCFDQLSFRIICYTTLGNKNLSASKCCGTIMETQDVGVALKLESVQKIWTSLRRVLSARMKSFQ